jgi:MoaA/NifB/PqqE/SkfB family radical SAM enzyme
MQGDFYMSYFDLKVGFSCNNDCVHCVVADKRSTRDLTTEEIEAIIRNVPRGDTIGFTGGEATIRADFIELIRFAKETGHQVSLQTNGARFSDWNFAQQAAKYLDNVLIAIHSHLPDVHTSIVRVPSMYEQTIQGFKNLLRLRVNMATQTVISKLNIPYLLETYDFLQSLAPGIAMNLTYPHPNGNAFYNADVVVPRYTEIKPVIQAILAKYAHLIQTEAIPMCYLYPYQDAVAYNFDEHIVEEHRAGIDPANTNNKYFDQNGVTQDYSLSMMSEKRKGPKCAQCVFNNRCAGVWKEYVQIHGKYFDLFPINPVQASTDPTLVAQNRPPENEMVNTTWGSIILYGPGSQCMNSCTFCNGQHSDISAEERLKQAVKEADYFASQGIRQIEISGGDPGEFPFLVQFVHYLRDRLGMRVIQLSTHGRTLKDPHLTYELKQAGVTSVRIPLYGVNAETHNKTAQFRSTPGNAFEDTMLGIKNCVAVGLPIVGFTVLNRFTKTEINNIIQLYIDLAGELLKEMYIGLIFISKLDYSYTDGWYLPIKDMGPYLQEVYHNHPNLPATLERFVILDVPYCVLGEYTDLIENKFMGFPNLGLHKIENGNASEISDKIPHYRIKSYFEACRSCALQERCGAVPLNELKMFGTYGLKPLTTIQNENCNSQ